MHADEVTTDVALVRRLLAAQQPAWSRLTIEPVASAGTDHAIYRLGSDMAVRLPRIASAVGQQDAEWHWLPRLAPHLPLTIPTPLARGEPAEDYPFGWSVYRWIEGRSAVAVPLADPVGAARSLGAFVARLRAIDAAGAPGPGHHNNHRGAPLAERDAQTRRAIHALGPLVDWRAVTMVWDAALEVPPWRAAGVWHHGDLLPSNLLIAGGELTAVIDFGCLGAGDPACDVLPAWAMFDGDSRAAYRAAIGVDEATWARGRGWALSWALVALPYYLETNPVIAATARRTIRETVEDSALT